ncbi:ash family protein [Salmonella enterica subsp. enterica serovar Derby]|nr:ash family protein [Salmonella enterica subsp. enterica serovar Derby]MBJ4493414.1 ash family protein [Salmonella enterica subsp. enterica serovar Derby]MBJ4507240.1 ash family protein [Salmonella enterica subsp. enterica serovar Derby]
MNSLTANNRLSQQLVVSVAEHLLLRHECRLPNHLAVSNHRELYLTVGGELCRNLTAGFVTEEGFMSMLFVGSQKHSALSIFAKTTRMSALVLCGNSGVILLSVKRQEHIDSAIPGRYTVQAPHKAGAGIGVLELLSATNDAPASFLLSQLGYIQIMVGWVGAPKGAPVSDNAGYANPAQFTTSEIGVSGGGVTSKLSEAAIMATVPALSRLNDEDLHKLSYVTTALRALRKVTLSDPQAHQVLVETLLNLQAERIRLADKANFHIHRLLNISGGHRHA